ncbi:MAG: substrate-binding domain-containing protein [Verrucomicrobia bacterium]|nr:substrate-binding domain-containing protein [Verrucomicrobiota bacterium]
MSNDSKKDRGWLGDDFALREVLGHFWWVALIAITLLVALLLPSISCFKRPSGAEVVIYAAQDQVYAEPILCDFERATGIKVKAVYDSEAVKTVGLANRLLAERSHPRGDVFWGNEEMRTRQLAAQSVFRETNGWAAFGHRSRRIVVNTNFISLGRAPAPGAVSLAPRETPADRASAGTREGMRAPQSLLELTNEIWRGRVALAFPQFGTTATHFHALKQLWGEQGWLAWCRALAANRPFVVDGNSVVVKFVGRGEAWIGLTDSDDVFAGQREGLPVGMLPVNEEQLLIPNTVGVIRGAPNPHPAQRLFEYLQRQEVVDRLVAANALEGAIPKPDATAIRPDWEALLRNLETTTKQLNEIFLR